MNWALGGAKPMTIVNGKNYIGGSGSHQTLLGTTGDDWIDGEGGNDFVDGRSGNDDVLGGAANDTVIGDTGDDHVSGNADNDLVVGMAGMDFVFGDDGDDFVSGGDGNDYIETNEGIDRYADGGVGNDFIAFVADFGTASLADYQASSHEYAFNGARGGVGKDIVRGVETVGFLSGGADSDIIDGRLAASTPYVLAAGQIRSQSLRLLGGAGNDIILGGKLNNAFFGEQDAAPISALDDWAVDGVISPGSGSFGFFTNWGITSSASDPVAGAISGASNADEDIFVIGANIRYNATSTHYDTIIDFDVSKDKIDISSTRTSEEEALASVVSVSGGHCQFTVTTRFNDTRIVVLEGVTKSEFEQYFEAVFSVGNSAAISDNAGSSSSSTINSINNTHLPIPSFNAAYSGSRNDLEWSSSSPISGIEIWRGNWIVNMGISSQRNSIGFGHDIYLDDTVPGSMTISGNDGQDIILMSDGNDGIHGDDQADLLIGGGGDDAIEGNRGNDFILGGNGDDAWLIGGWGNDLIDGGGGNDAIEGEYGDDRILGNGGADVVSGGFGNDTIFGDGQVGRDGSSALNNGIGTFESWFEADFLAWLPSSGSQFTSTSTTLKRTSVSNEVALHFDISSKSYSGAFLVGSSGGNAGDTVYGDFGNDLIFGGAGSADSIYGGSGNDTIYGHGGSVGEADGNDTIRSGSGNDSVGGGLGDDSIIGNFGDDYLSGDAGNDTIVAGKGADTLIGGDGADNMEAGAGVDKFLFDNLDGQDTISGFALVDDYLMFNSNVGIGILSHNSSATVLSYSGGSGKITILGVDIASITELNYSYTWT